MKYLIEESDLPRTALSFDERDALSQLDWPKEKIKEAVDCGLPFMTNGCPDREGVMACNRPYGSYRPGEAYRDYPFLPNVDDIEVINEQMQLDELRAYPAAETSPATTGLALHSLTNLPLKTKASSPAVASATAPVRYVDLGRCSPADSQAYYHAVAELMTEDTPDTIIFCQPATPYLCLGYHQAFDQVLDRERCADLNLPVMRRRVGGGTTYLDGCQIFYQCIFFHRRLPAMFQRVYRQMLTPPIVALQRLGIDAELQTINEIEVDGRRIAGIGGGRIGDAAVVVGNILQDFNYSILPQVWHSPDVRYRELATAALRERVTTVRQQGSAVSMAAIGRVLTDAYQQFFPPLVGAEGFTDAEHQRAKAVSRRMVDPDYLDLHRERLLAKDVAVAPLKVSARSYIHHGTLTLDMLSVQAYFEADETVIRQARLTSYPSRDWQPVERRLVGIPMDNWQAIIKEELV